MYCTNCGFHLNDDDAFCSNCGQRVNRRTHYNHEYTGDIHQTYDNIMEKPKNRIIAGLLAVFLGSMGIHDFYLGYNKNGVIHLLMFVFFLGWISQIWALFEALNIFTGRTGTDSNGLPLTDNF